MGWTSFFIKNEAKVTWLGLDFGTLLSRWLSYCIWYNLHLFSKIRKIMRKHSFPQPPTHLNVMGISPPYTYIYFISIYIVPLLLFFKSYSCWCCSTDMVYEKYLFIRFTVSFTFPSGIDNVSLVPLILFVPNNYIFVDFLISLTLECTCWMLL